MKTSQFNDNENNFYSDVFCLIIVKLSQHYVFHTLKIDKLKLLTAIIDVVFLFQFFFSVYFHHDADNVFF